MSAGVVVGVDVSADGDADVGSNSDLGLHIAKLMQPRFAAARVGVVSAFVHNAWCPM
jgi:hypothetical protein